MVVSGVRGAVAIKDWQMRVASTSTLRLSITLAPSTKTALANHHCDTLQAGVKPPFWYTTISRCRLHIIASCCLFFGWSVGRSTYMQVRFCDPSCFFISSDTHARTATSGLRLPEVATGDGVRGPYPAQCTLARKVETAANGRQSCDRGLTPRLESTRSYILTTSVREHTWVQQLEIVNG